MRRAAAPERWLPSGAVSLAGRERVTLQRAVAGLVVAAVLANPWLGSEGREAEPAGAVVPAVDHVAWRELPARKKKGDGEWLKVPEGVWDVGAYDMDADQRLDLVMVTGGPGSLVGQVVLLFNPAVDTELSDWPKVSLPTPGDYGRVAVGDINGDGIEDVAALTFGSALLRWWLLSADHGVLDERSMSFSGAELPGRTCPGPEPVAGRPLTLASLAFADLDVDHQLELAVAGYASGTEGGTFLFSFDGPSGCFEPRPGFVSKPTRGSLRLRFFDVDDDGAPDLVASHYALTRPRSGAARACPDCLEWGQWWPQSGGTPEPLVAQFGHRQLAAAEPTPELNVVDFDALRTTSGVRFALAGSAHLCPAEDCWKAGRAGFASVVDPEGREYESSDDWRQDVEGVPPIDGARLMPRAVSFGGARSEPSLTLAYWWATRQRNTPCGRVLPCSGPVTFEPAISTQARVLEQRAFAQALGFVGASGAPIDIRRTCQLGGPRALVPLPETDVAAIVEVTSNGRTVPPDRYSWVPGSRAVALAAATALPARDLCITYATSAAPLELVVADSKQGLLLIAL